MGTKGSELGLYVKSCYFYYQMEPATFYYTADLYMPYQWHAVCDKVLLCNTHHYLIHNHTQYGKHRAVSVPFGKLPLAKKKHLKRWRLVVAMFTRSQLSVILCAQSFSTRYLKLIPFDYCWSFLHLSPNFVSSKRSSECIYHNLNLPLHFQ